MLSRYERWRATLLPLPRGTVAEILEYMKWRWDRVGDQYSKPEGHPGGFVVKDSGARQEFSTGMKRDTTEGKPRYDLVLDGPMFERLAVHLTKGAVKYEPRNWMKAGTEEELERFRQSALRHFIQWFRGDVDEDHAAAVMFNVNGAEYVKDKLRGL